MRKIIASFIFVCGLTVSFLASAQTTAIYKKAYSDDAVSGYDTVAYFTLGEPTPGSDEFSYEYKGATWKFSSQEHMDMFIAEPEKYEPQYGGYCAYAMARGNRASAEPDLWTIHDDKLYLNLNKRVIERWRGKKEEYIEKADAEWMTFVGD